MKFIKYFIPQFMYDFALRLKGLFQYKQRKELQYNIHNSNNLIEDRWISLLEDLSNYGDRYSEFIKEYLECYLICSNKINFIPSDPTVICIVKNDILRMKLFLKYYRNMGFKQFAILDDNSDDGTLEFLKSQPDVRIYYANKSYSTVRRQVWINKIISNIGINRWYLVVDSDELFDFDNSSIRDINDLILYLDKKNIKKVKSLLLDMFSSNSLYADNIINEDDIIKEYSMFSTNYYLVRTPNNFCVRGGGREMIFDWRRANNSPTVSKYPLIKVESKDIIINSHFNYPLKSNNIIFPNTILRHYKFLPNDKKKYEERVIKKNFDQNSREYKEYLLFNNNNKYKEAISKMEYYESFDSTSVISIMRSI